MNTPLTSQPRQLTAIQIPAIDLTGNGGLGWDDLKDPHKGVAMFAVTPVGTVIGDYVELFWNNQPIQKFLTDPDRPSIDFSVLPQHIPDEPEVSEVFYRITPAAGGGADDSPIRQLRVKRTVPGGLDSDNDTPYINEHLAAVAGLPPIIELPVDLSLTIPAWDNMHEGDVLKVFWGSNQFTAENPPLASEQTGKPQTVIVPTALLVAAGNHDNLIVNYEVRDVVNNWSLYSVAAFTNVNILNLPAPTVSDAPEGVLDPLKAVAGATVMVPYPGMLATDEIRIRWNGREGVASPASQPGNPAGSVQFTVPPAAIAPVLGKTLQVTYVVTRGTDEVESDALTLTVQVLPSSALPMPEIRKTWDAQVLNVSKLNADAVLTVREWPFITTGQRLWLRFEGTAKNGAPHNWNHPVWQNFAITSDGEQNTQVALSELQKLKEGSSLRLILEVSFDEGLTRAAAPIKTLTIIFYYPVSGTEIWNTFPSEQLPFEQPVQCSDGLILKVSGNPAGITNMSKDFPSFGEQSLEALDDCTLAFDFGGFFDTLSLSHVGANSSSNTCKVFDAYDDLIVSVVLKSERSIVTETLELSRPGIYCLIHLSGNTIPVLLDNLGWSSSFSSQH